MLGSCHNVECGGSARLSRNSLDTQINWIEPRTPLSNVSQTRTFSYHGGSSRHSLICNLSGEQKGVTQMVKSCVTGAMPV